MYHTINIIIIIYQFNNNNNLKYIIATHILKRIHKICNDNNDKKTGIHNIQ